MDTASRIVAAATEATDRISQIASTIPSSAWGCALSSIGFVCTTIVVAMLAGRDVELCIGPCRFSAKARG